MSITLAMEPEIALGARAYAAAHGTTMSQMIREYFASLVAAPAHPTGRADAFRALVDEAGLRSQEGWKFSRDEASARG